MGDKLKLEDIQKENIYKTPDHYFEELPGIIQNRVAKKPEWSLSWGLGLKWAAATALLIILVVGYFLMERVGTTPVVGPSKLIAQVSTDDLILYLETTDIETYEIVDEFDGAIEPEGMKNDNIIDNMSIEDEDILEIYNAYEQIL